MEEPRSDKAIGGVLTRRVRPERAPKTLAERNPSGFIGGCGFARLCPDEFLKVQFLAAQFLVAQF